MLRYIVFRLNFNISELGYSEVNWTIRGKRQTHALAASSMEVVRGVARAFWVHSLLCSFAFFPQIFEQNRDFQVCYASHANTIPEAEYLTAKTARQL